MKFSADLQCRRKALLATKIGRKMFNSLTLTGSQKIDFKKNQLHKEADNNSLLLSWWRKRFVGEPTYIIIVGFSNFEEMFQSNRFRIFRLFCACISTNFRKVIAFELGPQC